MDIGPLSTSQGEELAKENVCEMLKVVKRGLELNGYIVLFFSLYAFGEWFESFKNGSYAVMHYLYVFGYRTELI